MDTSDESGDNHPFNFNDLGISDGMEPSGSTQLGIQQQAQHLQALAPTPEEQADELIKHSERAKAQIYEVKGKDKHQLMVAQMDEDYQMIDSHSDDNLRDKILNWKYVDFFKLVPKTKGGWEEEHQRLEIINENGVSFLSPVSERESVQITSYSKWEQAFRIYLNVVTLKYAKRGLNS